MKKLLTLILSASTLCSFGQKTEINVIRDIKKIKAAKVVNVMDLSDAIKVDLYNVSPPNEHNEVAADIPNNAEVHLGNLFTEGRNKKGQPPILAGGFETAFRNYMPNDDDIAISNQGMVMAMTNSYVSIYDEHGNQLKQVTDLDFFNVPVPSGLERVNVFDPHVSYDPIRDRWVAVVDYINYNTNVVYDMQSSSISLGFSKTGDPTGEWNFYHINSYFKIGPFSMGLDYPELAFTDSELIVTGNLTRFTNEGTRHTVLYQIPLDKGYAGESLNMATHVMENHAGYRACSNRFSSSSDKLYLIHSSANAPELGTRTLEFAYLDGTIEQGGKISHVYNLNMDKYYYGPPHVDQKGSSVQLDIRNSVFRSGFTDGNKIYAVQSTMHNNKAALYYLVLEVDDKDPEFSKVSTIIISEDDKHISYGSIGFAGVKDSRGVNAVAIGCCYASQDHYPGIGMYYITSDGQVSDMLVVKEGEFRLNWPSQSGNLSRWGDYSDVAERYNFPGELWVGGGYGRSDGRSG
ncbi:MAG: hypothetical protein KJP21_04415, partial [Bacteroidia bacterium]|nr:hypothetical protein [Bacteroidia bacterium]